MEDLELADFLKKVDLVTKQVEGLQSGALKPEEVVAPDESWAYNAALSNGSSGVNSGSQFPTDNNDEYDIDSFLNSSDYNSTANEERERELELQRKWTQQRIERLAREEHERWWKLARIHFGEGGITAMKEEQKESNEGNSIGAKSTPKGIIDYSWWDKWVQNPDDAVTVEEARKEAEALEKAKNEEFEKNNPGFVAMIKGDLDQRATQEKLKEARSDQLRKLGNDAFIAKDMNKALLHYHEALELVPLKIELLNNIAACHLSLHNFEGAVEFTTRALFVTERSNPHIPKALLRRGKGYQGLGKLELAVKDLEEASKLSPSNSEISSFLNILRVDLAEYLKEKDIPDPSPDGIEQKLISYLESSIKCLEDNDVNPPLPPSLPQNSLTYFETVASLVQARRAGLVARAIDAVMLLSLHLTHHSLVEVPLHYADPVLLLFSLCRDGSNAKEVVDSGVLAVFMGALETAFTQLSTSTSYNEAPKNGSAGSTPSKNYVRFSALTASMTAYAMGLSLLFEPFEPHQLHGGAPVHYHLYMVPIFHALIHTPLYTNQSDVRLLPLLQGTTVGRAHSLDAPPHLLDPLGISSLSGSRKSISTHLSGSISTASRRGRTDEMTRFREALAKNTQRPVTLWNGIAMLVTVSDGLDLSIVPSLRAHARVLEYLPVYGDLLSRGAVPGLSNPLSSTSTASSTASSSFGGLDALHALIRESDAAVALEAVLAVAHNPRVHHFPLLSVAMELGTAMSCVPSLRVSLSFGRRADSLVRFAAAAQALYNHASRINSVNRTAFSLVKGELKDESPEADKLRAAGVRLFEDSLEDALLSQDMLELVLSAGVNALSAASNVALDSPEALTRYHSDVVLAAIIGFPSFPFRLSPNAVASNSPTAFLHADSAGFKIGSGQPEKGVLVNRLSKEEERRMEMSPEYSKAVAKVTGGVSSDRAGHSTRNIVDNVLLDPHNNSSHANYMVSNVNRMKIGAEFMEKARRSVIFLARAAVGLSRTIIKPDVKFLHETRTHDFDFAYSMLNEPNYVYSRAVLNASLAEALEATRPVAAAAGVPLLLDNIENISGAYENNDDDDDDDDARSVSSNFSNNSVVSHQTANPDNSTRGGTRGPYAMEFSDQLTDSMLRVILGFLINAGLKKDNATLRKLMSPAGALAVVRVLHRFAYPNLSLDPAAKQNCKDTTASALFGELKRISTERVVGISNACHLLGKMAAVKELLPLLHHLHVVEPLLLITKLSGSQPKLRENASSTLAKIATFPPCKEQLVKLDGMKVLMAIAAERK